MVIKMILDLEHTLNHYQKREKIYYSNLGKNKWNSRM